MVSINWTNEAQFWLKEIRDYIALDSPKIASKIINTIYKKTQILKSYPRVGYRYKNNTDLDIRILLYKHYRIVYLIKNPNTIDILGIFHGSLMIEKYLNIPRTTNKIQ